VYPISMKSLP